MTVALESSGAATAKERYEDRVATAIAAIARDLEGETPVVGPGDRAELRRGWEGGIGSAFWRLAARHLEPRGLAISGEEEGRWVIVAAGLAETSGLPRSASFGRAAAAAEVSEQRILRLLRAEGDALHRSLRGVVTQIAQRGLGFDWRDPALLVLFDGTDKQDGPRGRIARDYYRFKTVAASDRT